MNKSLLQGVIVPVITPLDHEERVDEIAFRKALRRLIIAGVHGIFVGGSAGEGPLLTESEWYRMVTIAKDEVGDTVPLLGGAIEASTRKVCGKIKILAQCNYRWCVLTSGYYIAQKTQSEHLRLFGQARETVSDMEIIAYNIPQCTGSTLAVDTVCEMAKRGWIRYCKESSGDAKYFNKLISLGMDVGLNVLAGDELTCDQALLAGARGLVPVCANYNPELFLQLFNAGAQGDHQRVLTIKPMMLEMRETLVLSGPCWLSGIKYAMAKLGIGTGKVLSPLEPADNARMARIDAMIQTDQLAKSVV